MNEKVGYCLKVTPLNSSGSKIEVRKVLFPLDSNNAVRYDWLKSQIYGQFYFLSGSFFALPDLEFTVVYCYKPYSIDYSLCYPWSHPFLAAFGVSRFHGPFFIFKRFYVGKKGYLGCFSFEEATAIEKFIIGV